MLLTGLSVTNLTRSLAVRAVLALLLMVGFYLLGLGISAFLLWIPYAEYVYFERVDLKIALGCVMGAAGILLSLAPRVDRFTPPGPFLAREDVPRLFSLIDEVAHAAGQEVPSEVYLLNEVNAWVTQRGGVMGFGSHRVMGVGLPLLENLSVGELRAVIAHEFGHYVGGDVAIGPWIHKTRSAIGRAVQNMDKSILQGPFVWYGRLFMRVTLAVSRRQEFVADEVAARIAGSEPMSRALRQVASLAPAHFSYLHSELVPLLRLGYLPPIAEGFRLFMGEPKVAAAFAAFVDAQTTGADAGQYDTHPPLEDRLAALKHPSAGDEKSPRSGVEDGILSDPDAHAHDLLRFTVGDELVRSLKAVAWKDVGRVHEELWQNFSRHHGTWFGSWTPERVPIGKEAFSRIGLDLVKRTEIGVTEDERIGRAVYALTAGIGLLLVRTGWSLEKFPGRPVEAVKDGRRFIPSAAVGQLCNGSITPEAWKSECEVLGICGLPIAAPLPSAAAQQKDR